MEDGILLAWKVSLCIAIMLAASGIKWTIEDRMGFAPVTPGKMAWEFLWAIAIVSSTTVVFLLE